MLRRLRGQDARGGFAAKTLVLFVVLTLAVGSAPVLIPLVRWVAGVLLT